MKGTKVFIVDDSAVVRHVVTAVLSEAGFEVIGSAIDPIFALEKMAKQWPDVIVLDVEMPRMDGITFLRKIMAEHPTPVVMCSSMTEVGAQTTLEALSAGAVGFFTKTKLGVKEQLETQSGSLVEAVRAATHVNFSRLRAVPPRASAPLAPASGAMVATTEKIVAVGTSAGGTRALEVVLSALPAVCPGLVVVQHMPEKFTAAFAARLNRMCAIEVREAQDNDRVLPGRALIAPGGRHMGVKRSGAQYYVRVKDGPLVNRHRPSVDVLFHSVADCAGRNAMGIIMTGMGDDGARGLALMRKGGAFTVAEHESTCVVYGMPREAVKLGAVDQELPLGDIAVAIIGYGNGFRQAS